MLFFVRIPLKWAKKLKKQKNNKDTLDLVKLQEIRINPIPDKLSLSVSTTYHNQTSKVAEKFWRV